MDLRKNANVKKGTMFKMEWMHSDYVEHFLNHLALIHGCDSILNLCSGSSKFGTERVDYDKTMDNKTMYANMFDFLKYNELKFDMVFVDPPFEYYNPKSKAIAKHYPTVKHYGNPFEWQYQALSFAKKILVLRRPLIMTNWSGNISKFQEYFLIRDSRPSATILELVWCK